MAELADAPDLGSGVPDVQVQVLLSASNGAKQNTGCLGFAPFCASNGTMHNASSSLKVTGLKYIYRSKDFLAKNGSEIF